MDALGVGDEALDVSVASIHAIEGLSSTSWCCNAMTNRSTATGNIYRVPLPSPRALAAESAFPNVVTFWLRGTHPPRGP